MNSLHFKKNEFKKLCFIIGIEPSIVRNVVENIDSFYHEWYENKLDKKTGDFKRYKDGTKKQRVLRPSLKELKLIQKRIKDKILTSIELPVNIHGGVKKKTNITNARLHKGKKYQFTTDLQDFYPNISSKFVYETFVGLGFSTHFSHWLTKLTTWKYGLPQGAPTSTHMANLVFLNTDKELIKLCEKHNITYTRYIDDLTFSSQQDFKPILNEILSIITGYGFKISYRKTNYKSGQSITGIKALLHKIEAPKTIEEKAKAESNSTSTSKPYTNYLSNINKVNKSKVTNK
ncbi:MAG: reverse transcriptase family protein [bacterium]